MDLLMRARRSRPANLLVVNLRILLGFAFLPSGLKKVLDEPFTDPANVGAFHEFLHAFRATGFFYQFVGSMQLVIAVLLMTQTCPALAAVMAIPVFLAISVFCWSTAAYFTAFMATLMLLSAILLALWDVERWQGLFGRQAASLPDEEATAAIIDRGLWRRCGLAILVLYLAICAYSGGIYRPRGVELDNPAFYSLPLVAVFPVVTFVIESARRRRARRAEMQTQS